MRTFIKIKMSTNPARINEGGINEVLLYGIPVIVRSDGGPQFDN